MPAPPPTQPDGLVTVDIKVNGQALKDSTHLAEVVVDLDGTRPGMFILRFTQDHEAGEFASIDASIGDLVEVAGGYDNTNTTLITGEVTSIEADYGGAGQRFTMRGFDKSHRLQRARQYKAFLNVKDSDLASQLASAAGLSAGEITATSAVHKYIVQAHQTDWDFLKWRAAENGLTVDFADDKLNFRKPDIATDAVLAFNPGINLIAFRPRLHAPRVSSVTVRAWDEITKAALESTVGSLPAAEAATIGKTPASLSTSFGSTVHTTTVRSIEDQSDLDALSAALAARHADSFVEAEAVAQGSGLAKPGALIEIQEAGKPFDGTYRITSVKHTLAHGEYLMHMRFSGIQDKSLLALTSGNGNNASSSRTPRIEGVVTATVANVNDPELRCRVKLQFPWLGTTVDSEWARVMQQGAGADRGAVIMPEVGDEVLVSFEQGDVNRPYVIGGLYNGKDKPTGRLKYTGDQGVNLRGLASVSGHKLALVDTANGDDKVGIHLITGDDQLEIYLNKDDKKITIDCKSGKVEIHGMDDVTIKSDKNINIEATQKLTLKGTTGIDINSPQDVSVSGLNAKITANVGATLSGNATVEVKSSGMAKLQGSLVQIN